MGIIGAFSNKLKVTHIAPLLHDAILGHHSMAIDQIGVLSVIISQVGDDLGETVLIVTANHETLDHFIIQCPFLQFNVPH